MPTSVKLILHRSAIRSRKVGDFPNTERSQAPSAAHSIGKPPYVGLRESVTTKNPSSSLQLYC